MTGAQQCEVFRRQGQQHFTCPAKGKEVSQSVAQEVSRGKVRKATWARQAFLRCQKLWRMRHQRDMPDSSGPWTPSRFQNANFQNAGFIPALANVNSFLDLGLSPNAEAPNEWFPFGSLQRSPTKQTPIRRRMHINAKYRIASLSGWPHGFVQRAFEEVCLAALHFNVLFYIHPWHPR